MVGVASILLFLPLTFAPGDTFAPFFVSAQEIPSVTVGCEQACAELNVIFGPSSAIHYPGNDPDFRIWDAKQAEVVPACRVEPSSTADVVRILSILKDKWCTFAIKGGGHSRSVDASNSAGGVTVDMNRLSTIDVLEDRESSWLGAGLKLLETYRGLEAEGLSNVGGRVDSVGVAGFTMGGGFSNLTPKLGLAVDNVLEFELVLPNATVVTVNYEIHPDLYYALRGGANNFGIVTRFRVRVVPQGQQLFGQRIFSPNYTSRVLEEAHRLATDLSNNTDMSYWTRYEYNQSSDSFVPSMFMAYLQPELEPAVFNAVNTIPYERSTLRVDWMSNHIAAPVPFGERHLYATLTYTSSAQLEGRIWEIFSSEVTAVRSTPGFRNPAIVTQPIPANGFVRSQERGGNALGLKSPNNGPLSVTLLTIGWRNAADDEAMYTFVENWRLRSVEAAKQMGLWNRYLYINYCKEDQDPFGGYGEENHQRLQKIQRSVDPEGIFTTEGLNRGYFKLH